MATELRLFEHVPTAAEYLADKRERSEDLTPRMVARALIGRALALVVLYRSRHGAYVEFVELGLRVWVSKDQPFRALDVCAGYGAWGSEFAHHWVSSGLPREWLSLIAVELDSRKRGSLVRWVDVVIIGDWREAFTGLCYDIVIGNPAFPQARAPEGPDGVLRPDESMVAVALRHAHAIALYNTQQAWTKTRGGSVVRMAFPPAAIWDCPDSVGHRGRGNGADSVPYSFTLWVQGHSGRSVVELIDPVHENHRQWDTPPGTETVEQARALGLPLAPAWERGQG